MTFSEHLPGVQVQEVQADAGHVAQSSAPRFRRKPGMERPEVESSGRGGERRKSFSVSIQFPPVFVRNCRDIKYFLSHENGLISFI